MTRPLPIDDILPGLLADVRIHGGAVLLAPPGAGKTTRVPPALMSWPPSESASEVILVQPRRIAARAAAARIAEERGVTLGEEVGYQVRFESKVSKRTRLRVVTGGILLRRLQHDPQLGGVGAIVLDEFHERSLELDLLLAMLREVRTGLRDDLVLVVMSATLDAEPVAAFLGDLPVHRSDGREHPVDIQVRSRDPNASLDGVVSRAIAETCPTTRGHTLVFLPGVREIEACQRALSTTDFIIHPLHGRLTLAQQQDALRPCDARKIILATNVAETSLTVDGVDLVIDTALHRTMRHDAGRGADRLETRPISRASARQRAGRAGRQGPGRALRLAAPMEERLRPEHDPPEIQRVELSRLVLEIAAWGVRDVEQFELLDAPPAPTRNAAATLLKRLGALDDSGQLTALGRILRRLPCHPRHGRLLIEAHRAGWLEEGARLAALLEDGIYGAGPLDVMRRRHEAPHARRVAKALADDLRRIETVTNERPASARDVALRRALLAAFPDRLARRDPQEPTRAKQVGGGNLQVASLDDGSDDALFLVLATSPVPRDDGSRRVTALSPIERDWLEGPHLGTRDETTYDARRDRVMTRRRARWLDLALDDGTERPTDPDDARALLLGPLTDALPRWIAKHRASAQWQARIRFLAQHVDDELTMDSLETWAQRILDGQPRPRSLAQIEASPWSTTLRDAMPYNARRRLEQWAPETIEVPSGSHIRLDYDQDGPPVLAVRLQELFGLAETPRVANGRVPVLLHLLGPNHRPVQVTQDLRSFWDTTYVQVRKDLRGRYPKHAWPDDPWNAPPQKGAKRRR